MKTVYSFVRTRLTRPILKETVAPFDMYVSNANEVPLNSYVTVSPNTPFEELMEVGTKDIDAGYVRVTKRGLDTTMPTPTENSGYRNDHYTNDEVRGDINHLHLYDASTAVLGTNNTYTGDNIHSGTETFNGPVDFEGKLNLPEFANTTARDLVFTSPASGDVCVTNGVLQWYNGGLATWQSVGSSTPVPDASETNKGIAETATQAEVEAGTANDTLFVAPSKLATFYSNRKASQGEVTTGTDDTKYITPLKLATAVPQASDTVSGKVELATADESVLGTDNTKALTPFS